MSADELMRLEALRLASGFASDAAELVEAAEVIYLWMTGASASPQGSA